MTPAGLARAFGVTEKVSSTNEDRRPTAGGRDAMDRTLPRLQALADALQDGRGLADVAASLLDRGIVATGASAGAVAVVADDGAHLELAAASGWDERLLAAWERWPLDRSVPAGDAIASRRTIVCATSEEICERYPAIASFAAPSRALAAFPILDGETALGSVVLTFDVGEPVQPPRADAGGLALSFPRTVVPALLERIGQLERALDSRVAIEQAKGILAERHDIGLDEAFERIRHRARDRGARVRVVAEEVVRGEIDL
jgi:GAF domain-containing protein